MQNQYLTKAQREEFSLPVDLKQILVGLLLGDLSAQKRFVNATLRFEQGTIHKEYIEYLYKLMESHCPSGPKISIRQPDKRTGEVYSNIYF